jgi:hypothetical protein
VKPRAIAPYRDRHPKECPTARCCWVCGKLGGQGFTTALRSAGYRMEPNEMGYAHPKCMTTAARQAAQREHT